MDKKESKERLLWGNILKHQLHRDEFKSLCFDVEKAQAGVMWVQKLSRSAFGLAIAAVIFALFMLGCANSRAVEDENNAAIAMAEGEQANQETQDDISQIQRVLAFSIHQFSDFENPSKDEYDRALLMVAQEITLTLQSTHTVSSRFMNDPARRTLSNNPLSYTLLLDHRSGVYSMAFSPDGETAASASGDGTIQLWDLSEILAGADPYASSTTLTGHELIATALAFSPDGKILASASYDGTIRLWDLDQILSDGTIRLWGLGEVLAGADPSAW